MPSARRSARASSIHGVRSMARKPSSPGRKEPSSGRLRSTSADDGETGCQSSSQYRFRWTPSHFAPRAFSRPAWVSAFGCSYSNVETLEAFPQESRASASELTDAIHTTNTALSGSCQHLCGERRQPLPSCRLQFQEWPQPFSLAPSLSCRRAAAKSCPQSRAPGVFALHGPARANSSAEPTSAPRRHLAAASPASSAPAHSQVSASTSAPASPDRTTPSQARVRVHAHALHASAAIFGLAEARRRCACTRPSSSASPPRTLIRASTRRTPQPPASRTLRSVPSRPPPTATDASSTCTSSPLDRTSRLVLSIRACVIRR